VQCLVSLEWHRGVTDEMKAPAGPGCLDPD
jgi:hypothetical protein